MLDPFKDNDLEGRKIGVPKVSMKNEIDRKIVITIIVVITTLLLALATFLIVYFTVLK